MSLSFSTSVYVKLVQMPSLLKEGKEESRTKEDSGMWEPTQKKYVGCVRRFCLEGRQVNAERAAWEGVGRFSQGYVHGCSQEVHVLNHSAIIAYTKSGQLARTYMGSECRQSTQLDPESPLPSLTIKP